MTNRVTATELKQILDTDLDDAVVDVHITIANDLVTSLLSSAGYSSTRLKNIEWYLSAHLISIGRDRLSAGTTAEWISSEAKADFMGDFGKQLDSTTFGQTVKLLDTSAILTTLGRERARFQAVNFSTAT